MAPHPGVLLKQHTHVVNTFSQVVIKQETACSEGASFPSSFLLGQSLPEPKSSEVNVEISILSECWFRPSQGFLLIISSLFLMPQMLIVVIQIK